MNANAAYRKKRSSTSRQTTGKVSARVSARETKTVLRCTSRRTAGGRPFSSIRSKIAASSPQRSDRAIVACVSGSPSTIALPECCLRKAICTLCLLQQHGQIGEALVPLDQAGHATEPTRCPLEERPDRRSHAVSVIVDQQRLPAALGAEMPGEMDLAHRL